MMRANAALTLILTCAIVACSDKPAPVGGKRTASGGGGSTAVDPGAVKKAPAGYAETKSDGWTTLRHTASSRTGRGMGGRGLVSKGEGARADRARYGAVAGASDRGFARPRSVSKTARRRPGGRSYRRPPMHIHPRPTPGPLRAGETDDNQKFAEYLRYHAQNAHLLPAKYRLDVSERYVITARDDKKRALPNVQVMVRGGGKVLAELRTDSQGRALFFPRANPAAKQVSRFDVSFQYGKHAVRKSFARGKSTATQGATSVQVKTVAKRPAKLMAYPGLVPRPRRKPPVRPAPALAAGGKWTVALPVSKQVAPVQLEVLFLLDTTGSMGDEIAQVQSTLLSISSKIRKMQGAPQIRFGMVLYRDRGDAYTVKRFNFTSDVQAFDQALRQVRAGGGGDGPEAMNMGLFTAVEQMKWSKNALRLVFLVADAPPHLDYQQDVPYTKTLRTAAAKGIKIFPTAASGLDRLGSYVMRQVAQYTGGKFLFIEYGQSGASHGVSGSYQTNNLDDIIVRIVRQELRHYAS